MPEFSKPRDVAEDPYKSTKWDEITAGRAFEVSDIPMLKTLVSWYQIADQCNKELIIDGYAQLTYENKLGDKKAMPQLGILKQASAEIRQLNKQLGIKDDHPVREDTSANANVLQLIQSRRKDRQSATSN